MRKACPQPAPTKVLRVSPQQLASRVFVPKLPALKHALFQKARHLYSVIEVAAGLAQDFILFVRQQKP